MSRGLMVAISVCLLGWIVSAAASGAWVLWARITSFSVLNPPDITWQIESAHTSKPECEAELHKGLDNLRHLMTGVVVQGNTVIVKATRLEMAYFCLPDALDPREPKR